MVVFRSYLVKYSHTFEPTCWLILACRKKTNSCSCFRREMVLIEMSCSHVPWSLGIAVSTQSHNTAQELILTLSI